MDHSGSLSSTSLGPQHDLTFPISRAPQSPSTFGGIKDVLISGFIRGLDSGSEQNTPRVLHSSDDGTPRSSELSFRPWGQPTSGASSVSNSCCPSPAVPSRLHTHSCQPAAAGPVPASPCIRAAAATIPNGSIPEFRDSMHPAGSPDPPPSGKRDQPCPGPGQAAAGITSEPPAKRAKRDRKPGPEDHLPWTERKIRRAKRAARSELSVSRGEW